MDGFFQERENVCGKELDAVFILHIRGNLPVVEPVLAQLDHFPCKFLLRTAAERAVTAVAAEEIIKKREDLVPHTKIECIIVQARAERLEHVPGERKLRKAIAGKSFQLFCVSEPCPVSNHSSSPADSSKFLREVIASLMRSHSISHSSKSVGFSRSSFTYFPQQAAPSITAAAILAAASRASSISFSILSLPVLIRVLISLSNPPSRYFLHPAKSASFGSWRIPTSSSRSPSGEADMTIASICESLSRASSRKYRLFW